MPKRAKKSAEAKYRRDRGGYRGGGFQRKRKSLRTKNTKLQELILARDYDAVLNEYARTPQMNELMRSAYQARRGYSLGNVKGEKILFVSGSRNPVDWMLNVADGVTPSALQAISNRTAENLTGIKRRNGADVAVGHSRGGMLVAKMDVPNHHKLGLDAATRIAPRDRRDVMNLYQDNPLDVFIGKGGTNRKKYPWGRYFHKVSRA